MFGIKTAKLLELRAIYEQVLGYKINDSTWWRVRKRLVLTQDSAVAREIVEASAELRKVMPNKRIEFRQVRKFLEISKRMIQVRCQGWQLLEGLKRLGPKPPSKATIYRWGKEIGIPFGMNRDYSPEELRRWFVKIALSKYKFREETGLINYG